ncbi:Inorganic phosphate transporter [Arachis hypogaea]|uniref:Inorganic phosphate transporter n=1 Tax=Arachis hypogaea TaxID=3818 RepID=A0A6B9V9X4_ARAHY|nr:Inorganic phosphate transporter [Arachis hypogaea]
MTKEPLQVLNALHVAKTQWYYFTAVVIAGMGFFTDASYLFCISLVTKLLGRLCYYYGSFASQVYASFSQATFYFEFTLFVMKLTLSQITSLLPSCVSFFHQQGSQILA